MYQYFVKVVPTMYNKLSGEVRKYNAVYCMTLENYELLRHAYVCHVVFGINICIHMNIK